jgi:hypothetical protein
MNEDRKLYEKNTTFTKPPGLPQIISYLVFALETVLFYVVVFPKLNSTAQIIFGIVYSLTLIGLVVSTITASSMDPSDQVMILYRNQTP